MLKKTKLHIAFPLYNDKPYGNNLWVIKQELGLSQAKLAELCNINIGQIARIERGDQQISDIQKQIIEECTGYKVEIYR